MSNRLANSSSPYLLQHADNPVDWYEWDAEALEKSRQEDKPIFLSIGYAACHWCHVMAHESFEDAETAKIMNENFINIKVEPFKCDTAFTGGSFKNASVRLMRNDPPDI